VVAVLILATVLGLPLGFTMLAGLNVLAPIGYITVALILGRVWVKGETSRGRIGAFFAGFGILRLVALVPGLGLVVWFLVCIYGIGAVSMAAWYGGHELRPRPGAPTEAPIEPPEMPPPPPPPELPADASSDAVTES
jgi:hypothetical protein